MAAGWPCAKPPELRASKRQMGRSLLAVGRLNWAGRYSPHPPTARLAGGLGLGWPGA